LNLKNKKRKQQRTLRGCQPLAKRGGMAVTLTLNEIKNKLNHINQNNTQINITKSE